MARKPRSFRVEAVVLRHSDFGEADRLLTLFTRELGKVRTVAKGVRKIRSRKAGHLEPFTHTNLLLARGRNLYIITQAETINAFLPIRENLSLIGYASYVLELLDRFTYEEDENRALYDLLKNTLARLCEIEDSLLVVRYYEIRLLDHLGYRPELVTCLECGAEIQPADQFFSASRGGVFCPSCGRNASGVRPISLTALKYLRHFQRSSYKEAARAQIPPEVHREIESTVGHYLTHLLERGLNSPSFIREMRKRS
jgi:DNA repair protein RecO (recombination protein O)